MKNAKRFNEWFVEEIANHSGLEKISNLVNENQLLVNRLEYLERTKIAQLNSEIIHLRNTLSNENHNLYLLSFSVYITGHIVGTFYDMSTRLFLILLLLFLIIRGIVWRT